jgi:hypothetical protein
MFRKIRTSLVLATGLLRLIDWGQIPKEKNMLRYRLSFVLLFATAIMLVASTVTHAGPKTTGGSQTVSSTLDVLTPVTVGGTSVQPGTYTVKVDGTTMTLKSGSKTVAQASIQWQDSTEKAKSTNILAENGAVKEIHFSGKTGYVTLAN